MVTSDFRPEVEIRPFHTCTMKNMQYNPYLWPNRRNFRVVEEIGVEEHDGNVRFLTGSGNLVVSCMRHASGHNYRNSSFIVDVTMGQIPRSTERIFSFAIFLLVVNFCNYNLFWSLPKHIPTFIPNFVHLSEYLYEMYHFY